MTPIDPPVCARTRTGRPPQWIGHGTEGQESLPAEPTACLPLEWPVADLVWRPSEVPLGDGRILVLHDDPGPTEAGANWD